MELQWITATAGGLMVGVSSGLYLILNGRVLGASGILGGLIEDATRDRRLERLAFLAGTIGFPAIIAFAAETPETHATRNIVILVAGGLMTGVGTRMAHGCTSGHALSGVSRRSRRSYWATLVFTLSAIVSLFIFRRVLGVV